MFEKDITLADPEENNYCFQKELIGNQTESLEHLEYKPIHKGNSRRKLKQGSLKA